MKTAKVNKYDASASLSWIGLSCSSRPIAGNAVERTVESRFSMNNAHATISGMRIRRGRAIREC